MCFASGPGKDMFDSTSIIAHKLYQESAVSVCAPRSLCSISPLFPPPPPLFLLSLLFFFFSSPIDIPCYPLLIHYLSDIQVAIESTTCNFKQPFPVCCIPIETIHRIRFKQSSKKCATISLSSATHARLDSSRKR